jgi:hypothetical protein
MTTNREQNRRRGAPQRPEQDQEDHLERRRAEMQAAEGHAGSIPRGNQRPQREKIGHRRGEWEGLLGH